MSKRILIVDDSSMMRKMISKILQPPDYIVVGEAKSGKEAVELYEALRPDIVTMDITMRDMDGFTAAREIFTIDNAARIIFLSNIDEDRYEDEIKQLGAVGFVNKHKSKDLLELINSQ